jgi:hypothetical protein
MIKGIGICIATISIIMLLMYIGARYELYPVFRVEDWIRPWESGVAVGDR